MSKNSRTLIVLMTALMLLVGGCTSTEKELAKLNYPEAEIVKLVELDYTKDLIGNKIIYGDLNELKRAKGFISDNLRHYVKVLNKAYTTEEMDMVIIGVNRLIDTNPDYEKLLSSSRDNIIQSINNGLTPQVDIEDSNEVNATRDDQGFDYLKEQFKAVSFFDGKISSKIEFEGAFQSNTIGEYELSFSVTDSKGFGINGTTIIHVVDKEKPSINVPNLGLIFEGDEIDLHEGVTGTDNVDGDITHRIVITDGGLDTSKPGTYPVTYKLEDAAGNVQEINRSIQVLSTVRQGETFELNKYEVAILSHRFNRMDSEPQRGFYSYYTADEGQTFVILSMRIKNLDDIRRTPFDTWGNDNHMLDAKLVYDNTYEYDDRPHSLDNNWYYIFTSLNPLTTQTKNITFSVPLEVVESGKSVMVKLNSVSNPSKFVYYRIN